MLTLAWTALGLGVALAIHLVAIPLVKRRAVLVRGREAYLAWFLVIASGWALSPWLLALLVVQAIVAWRASPWLVMGVTRDRVAGAASKAGQMIRLDVTPGASARTGLGATASMRIVRVVPRTFLVTFSPGAPRRSTCSATSSASASRILTAVPRNHTSHTINGGIMAVATGVVVINKPVSEVFAYTASAENGPAFIPNLNENTNITPSEPSIDQSA